MFRRMFAWTTRDHPDNARHDSWWVLMLPLFFALMFIGTFGWLTMSVWRECQGSFGTDVVVALVFTSLMTAGGFFLLLLVLIEAVAKIWAAFTRLATVSVS